MLDTVFSDANYVNTAVAPAQTTLSFSKVTKRRVARLNSGQQNICGGRRTRVAHEDRCRARPRDIHSRHPRGRDPDNT
jgi:hypothetical protein